MDQLEARLGEVAGLLRSTSAQLERFEARQHDMAQAVARQAQQLAQLGGDVAAIKERLMSFETMEFRVLALERGIDSGRSRVWDVAKECVKVGIAAGAGWVAGVLGGGGGKP